MVCDCLLVVLESVAIHSSRLCQEQSAQGAKMMIRNTFGGIGLDKCGEGRERRLRESK